MIELKFLKELVLIKQVNQKSAIFVILSWYFLDIDFKFQPNTCYGCHDLLMMSMNLSNISISSIKSPDCCCIISRISKSDPINLKQDTDLTKRIETL